eukprot:7388673-Prymnesium_polylepis.2
MEGTLIAYCGVRELRGRRQMVAVHPQTGCAAQTQRHAHLTHRNECAEWRKGVHSATSSRPRCRPPHDRCVTRARAAVRRPQRAAALSATPARQVRPKRSACPQHWARLPGAFGITAFYKQPPSVGHAKGELREGVGPEGLVDHYHSTRTEQLHAVAQRILHGRRCMKAIGRDDDVRALQKRIVTKANACLAKEYVRHVGEDVALTTPVNHRQEARCGATTASPDLEGNHLPPFEQQPENGLDRDHNAGIGGQPPWNHLERAALGRRLPLRVHRETEAHTARRAAFPPTQEIGRRPTWPLSAVARHQQAALAGHTTHRAACGATQALLPCAGLSARFGHTADTRPRAPRKRAGGGALRAPPSLARYAHPACGPLLRMQCQWRLALIGLVPPTAVHAGWQCAEPPRAPPRL